MGKLLSTKEAAQELGVSRRLIQELVRTGELPAQKLGRDWAIYPVDLKNLQNRRPIRGRGRPPKNHAR